MKILHVAGETIPTPPSVTQTIFDAVVFIVAVSVILLLAIPIYHWLVRHWGGGPS